MHLPPFRPNEWGVYATSKGLKKGDSLEFFYPSTEWDMAQGFDCACGSDVSFLLMSGESGEDVKICLFIVNHVITDLPGKD